MRNFKIYTCEEVFRQALDQGFRAFQYKRAEYDSNNNLSGYNIHSESIEDILFGESVLRALPDLWFTRTDKNTDGFTLVGNELFHSFAADEKPEQGFSWGIFRK